MMKKVWASVLSVGVLTSLAGCGTQAATADKTPTIGFTVYGMSSWVSWGQQGVTQLAKQEHVKVEWDSASNNIANQVSQMETFISQHVSAIVVDPVSSSALAPQIHQAEKAGIPVFGLNVRFYSSNPAKKYITGYVGPNDVLAGEHDMEAMAQALHGHGNIVILQGPIGQSATKDRTNGINTVLKHYPGIHVLAQQPANWSRSQAYPIMLDWISRYNTKINGVVSENDDMAIGAIRAMQQKGFPHIPVVGSDGIASGMKEIMAGRELQSNLQNAPLQMGEALTEAVDYLTTHRVVKKSIYIPCPIVTQNNVRKIYNQIYMHPHNFLQKTLYPLVKYDLKTHQYGNEFLPTSS